MFEYELNNDTMECTIVGIKDQYTIDEIKDLYPICVYIPDYYLGYKVTTIGKKAFKYMGNYVISPKIISIPTTITHIECYEGLDELISINNLYVDHNPILINNKFIYDRNKIYKIKYQIANDYYAVHCVDNTEYLYSIAKNN